MKKEFYFSVYGRNNKKPGLGCKSKPKDKAWEIKKIKTFLLPILFLILGYTGLTAQCTSYDGGPYNLGLSSCDVGGSSDPDFQAWDNEAYFTYVAPGGNYTFELVGCDPAAWGAPITITAIAGGFGNAGEIVNGTVLGSVSGECSITFNAPTDEDFIWFVLSTACGGAVNFINNGVATITTNTEACAIYEIDDACNTPFVDISASGTALGISDDGTVAISMPFDFTFFGLDYAGPSNMIVGNNGAVILNTVAGNIPAGNVAFPVGTVPAILPLWDDIGDTSGDVYWEVVGASPNRQLIIQWDNRPHYDGDAADTGTFQVVFHEGSGMISFLYDDVIFGDPALDNGASATIGIQSATSSVEYSFNSPVLDGVTCINFMPFGDDSVCGSQFTDMGGANGPYMANENSTTTICPDNVGDAVTVTFTSFDVEQSVFTGNCFDALTVYNGPDANADLIDAFCGNDDQNIPDPITSTDPNSGCLTFVFTSNGSNQGDGWVADITCSEVEACGTSVVVCNDNIQLSLGEDCETPVSPDMVLEGGCANINYSVELFTEDGTSIGDVVTSAEVGATLSVHVTHNASGNYCWGTITVEDKLKPTLECLCAIDQPLSSLTGELSEDDPTYNRISIDFLGACVLDGFATDVYYDATPFSVDAEGVYIFSMMFPGDGNASLYEGSFDPENPCENLIDYNDDSAGNFDPLIISALMSPGEYVLVSTSYENGETGEYSWAIDGPGGVYASNGDCDYTCLDLNRLLSEDIDAGAPEANDNCGIPEVTFEDEVLENACEGSVIIRSWIATDGSGNTAACAQEIRLRPLTLEDIIPNTQVDVACDSISDYPSPGHLDSLGIEGAYPTIISEGVTYNVTPTLCNVGATYEDAPIIDLCGGGYKIIRSWTIYDWCTSTSALFSQVIKVEDNDAPVINTCPEYGNVTANSNPNECNGVVVIQDLTDYFENCSNPSTVSVQFTMASGLVVDTEVGAQVQAGVGTHTITYTVTDNCGNASTCDTEVTIEDQTPPVTICDEHTAVSLGTDGNAEICWDTFDDGTYDNCGPLVIKVKRMDAGDDVEFTDCVWFDCADIQFDEDGNPIPIMVRMRAYDITPDAGFPDDASGRWNECMIEVEVQDKLYPILSCPGDKTEECQTPFSEIDGLTQDSTAGYPPVYYAGEFQGYYANAYDNCVGIVEVTDEGELDQCGEGTIYRTWLVTDAGGRTDICTQVITFENSDPFDGTDDDDLDWPRDATVDCGDGTEPDDLPNGRDRPEINEDVCDLIAVTYEDQYLPVVDSACYKILRTWTVIDWCQFDGLGDGVWVHTQIIKVRDEVAPEITPLDDITVCTFTNDCIENIELSVDATDECSDELAYHLFIDGYADGYVSTTANIGLLEGTHTIVWTVSDGCNNSATMEYNITVEDCKQPTPVCLNGLATVIMPSSGEITLWDSDFNAPGNSGSFDNCTPQDELRFRIRKVSPDNVTLESVEEVLNLGHDVIFTCDNLGFASVELYVVDNNDNWDYCTTYALIEDNNGVCIGEELAAIIEGHTETEAAEMVENVTVNIVGGQSAVPAFLTEASGLYNFEVPMYSNYTVTPVKDMNYLNGVTTFDLVMISQHILGTQSLSSPYKIIAADVNASNSVTTFDVVLLRQLILNIITELPTNDSWRFIDKGYVFPDATNPFVTTFPEVIAFNDIDANELAADFIGVKIGDVNASVIPNTLLGTQVRNRENDLLFVVDENNLKAGQEYIVDFTAKDFENILGYQFTLNFDQNLVQVADVVPGNLKNLSAANFGMSLLNEGVITASWNDAAITELKDDAVVFSVKLNALADTKVSNVFAISSKFTTAEAYNTTEEMGVAIAFQAENGIEVAGNAFELYQNKPNPFNNSTTIGFSLPNAEQATLSIYDVTGKVLRTYSEDFAKGYNEIVVNRAELSATGMLYYKLETSEKIATKKMIILE